MPLNSCFCGRDKISDFLFNHLPGSSVRLLFLMRYMEHRYTLYMLGILVVRSEQTHMHHELWTHHEASNLLHSAAVLVTDWRKTRKSSFG